MKKFAFIAIAAIFAATPSFAKWQVYGGMKIGSSEVKYYYDNDSISDNGRFRRVWVMEDGLNYDARGVFSAKYHYEFDCESKYFRSIRGILYGAPMGGGAVVNQSNNDMTEWLRVFPDSDLAKVDKFVCRRQ